MKSSKMFLVGRGVELVLGRGKTGSKRLGGRRETGEERRRWAS